jgi:hypothetical protein
MTRCWWLPAVFAAFLGCGKTPPAYPKPLAQPGTAGPDRPVAPVCEAERHAFLERNVGRFKAGDDMAMVKRELGLERQKPRPHENQPPGTARDDYFFEGFVLIVEHGPRMNAQGEREAGTDVLSSLVLVRDGLSSAQREEAYAKSWSDFVRSRSKPRQPAPNPD